MAEQGKKIIFEGVDQTSNAAQAAKKNLIDLHDTNIKKTKEVNTVIQQGNDLLKEQLQLLEKQKQVIASMSSQGLTGAQAGAVGQITQKLFATPERVNPEHIRSFAKILEGMHLTGDPKGLSEKLIQKTQELIETQKMLHKETMQHHLKDDESQIPGAEKFKEFVQSFDKKMKGKEYGEITTEEKAAKRKSVEEEKEIRKQIFGGEAGGTHGGGIPLSFEGAIEKMTHKLATVLGIGAAGSWISEVVDKVQHIAFGRHAIHAGATTGTEASFQESEMAGEAWAYYKDIAGRRRHRAELSEFQAGQFGAFATTGRGYSMSTMGEQLGISAAETAAIMSGSSRARGRATSASELFGNQFANRVLGIDQGNISALENQSRFGGGANIKKVTEQVITAMGLEKDRSKANEYLQALVQLGGMNLNTLGRIDQKGDMALLKAFTGGTGALFKNAETLMPIISGLNTSLANPQSNFQKAERFATLSALHPGQSFPQLMREMQKGIKSEGYLKETMNRIAKRGGGRDQMVMELVSTGLVSNYEQAYELVDDYMNSHGTMFDQITGQTLAAGQDTSSQMKNVVDRFDKVSKAKIQNAFLVSPEAGYKAVEEEISSFDSSGSHVNELLNRKKDPLKDFAVATGDAADKMAAVKMRADEMAKSFKDTKESVDGFNSILKEWEKKGVLHSGNGKKNK